MELSMINKIILFIRRLVFNFSFVAGFLISIIIFAHYIFSPNNLYKDLKEDLLSLQKEKSGEVNNSLFNSTYHHRYYYK